MIIVIVLYSLKVLPWLHRRVACWWRWTVGQCCFVPAHAHTWTQSLLCWGRSQHNPGSDTEGKVPTQTETSQRATTRVHSGNTGNRMALGYKAFYAEEEANTIQLVMQRGKCQHKPKHHNRQGYIQETQDGSSSSSQTSYTLKLNSTKENFPHKTF